MFLSVSLSRILPKWVELLRPWEEAPCYLLRISTFLRALVKYKPANLDRSTALDILGRILAEIFSGGGRGFTLLVKNNNDQAPLRALKKAPFFLNTGG